VLGAAAQGASHRKLGLPCQDALDYRVLPGDIALLALADGAGSAERSAQGARWAVAEALRALAARPFPITPEEGETRVRQAFQRAAEGLALLAAGDAEPIEAYATTLSCAIAAPQWLAAGQVGDGALVARVDGEWRLLVRAQKGEYANETAFISQPGAPASAETCVLHRPVSALAAMSDGLTRLALQVPAGQPFPPFFDPLEAFARTAARDLAASQLSAFLTSDRVATRTADDTSLVIAVRG
jgi:hypothetical protein